MVLGPAAWGVCSPAGAKPHRADATTQRLFQPPVLCVPAGLSLTKQTTGQAQLRNGEKSLFFSGRSGKVTCRRARTLGEGTLELLIHQP